MRRGPTWGDSVSEHVQGGVLLRLTPPNVHDSNYMVLTTSWECCCLTMMLAMPPANSRERASRSVGTMWAQSLSSAVFGLWSKGSVILGTTEAPLDGPEHVWAGIFVHGKPNALRAH